MSLKDDAHRNSDPSLVMEHGFVELPALLDSELCSELSAVDMEGDKHTQQISNATELDMKHLTTPFSKAKAAVETSATIGAAMRASFGVSRFCLDEAKLLEAGPSAKPQIPHADDTNNTGGFFGVAHVRPRQAPTLAHAYEPRTFWVDATAACDLCKTQIRLTDEHARCRSSARLDASWTCESSGRAPACTNKRKSRSEPTKGEVICASFLPLLADPAGVIARMKPCGAADPSAGDALLALPTLIHRGPGGGGDGEGGPARRVLFFFVRPVFDPTRFEPDPAGGAFKYDPTSQVHAAFLLQVAEKLAPAFLRSRGLDRQTVARAYKALGHELGWFATSRGLRGGEI
mmetsp:Transcript_49456/g.163839  ORF Transcript_49456/g.163839 Transcript_49456/m.163839 type:complete len:346 (-) Transcript_49456:246-1283(-)